MDIEPPKFNHHSSRVNSKQNKRIPQTDIECTLHHPARTKVKKKIKCLLHKTTPQVSRIRDEIILAVLPTWATKRPLGYTKVFGSSKSSVGAYLKIGLHFTRYQAPQNWATFHRALQFERMSSDVLALQFSD